MKDSNSDTKSSKSSRCVACRKKTIILVPCKCSEQFCLHCRQPEDHNCKFDYSEHWKQKLTKDNPSVVGEKVSKI